MYNYEKLGNGEFPCKVSLTLMQNIFSLLVIIFLNSLGKIQVEPLKIRLLKSWVPLNLLLVMMLTSGMFSLAKLNIAMVTIFKNIQTICVALGDFLYFKEPLGSGSVVGIFVMLVGSFISGYNDLEFNMQGYAWILLNCLSGAGYVLYMKFAMLSTALSPISSAYYNNVLSIPILFGITLFNQEIYTLFDSETWMNCTWNFGLLILFNLLVGASMSFVGLWMVSETSPTTYSIAGAVNKLPLSLLSIWWFNIVFNWLGAISGFGALVGSIIYYSTKPTKQKIRPKGPFIV